MRSTRQCYYDLFSKVYDFVIRLHSGDREGSLRGFITEKANLSRGDKGLDKVAKAWEENNKKAAKRLMEIVGRQERNLETVAQIIDFTDSIYGVEGQWTEVGPSKAVKIEKSCPLAKQFPPETCTMCFSGSMQGIARGVLGHDKVFCRMPKSLPGGDDCCEIIIEVKE